MEWLRLYSSILNDSKIMLLPEVLRWRYVGLLCIASESKDRGVIPSDEEVLFKLRISENEWVVTLQTFIDRGLVEKDGGVCRVHGWSKRQYESDDSAPRVQKHRYNKSNVTAQDRYNTVTVTPPDTDTETAAALTPGPTVARASTTRTVAVKPNAKLSPAVNAYAKLTGKFPPRALHHLIDAAMATRDDPDLLRRCYETWLSRGFRPENNAWLLEWYTSGAIPQSQNGNSRPPPAQAGYAIRYTDKGSFLPDGSQV